MSEEPEVLLPTGEPRYCTTCGARVAELATSCLMCGSSFVPEEAEGEDLLPDWAKGLVVVLLGVAGGTIGAMAAGIAIRWTQFCLSVDGLSIPIEANLPLVAMGVGLSVALGVVSGLVPAWLVARQEIAACFRAV